MDIDPRTPHVPLINTEQLLEVEKTSFQYSPDISCMCLLRGLNGHIRVIYLASRQSVSSWRPKLPSSSLDAHCPPLEAWYLGCIRIASHAGVYPLTCEEAEGGWVSCDAAITVESAATVAAAERTTALSFAPSRRQPTLTTAAPPKHAKLSSRHHLLSAPRTLYELRSRYRSRSPCLPPIGE